MLNDLTRLLVRARTATSTALFALPTNLTAVRALRNHVKMLGS
ncbi:hypothetical protein [Bradyrhizobium paxllaeri]|nr:hypothetical protein [Bradyrhizobium paxllaeri]